MIFRSKINIHKDIVKVNSDKAPQSGTAGETTPPPSPPGRFRRKKYRQRFLALWPQEVYSKEDSNFQSGVAREAAPNRSPFQELDL